MELESSGRYVLLANLFASAGRWGDVAGVRKLNVPTPRISHRDVHSKGPSIHGHSCMVHQMLGSITRYVPDVEDVLAQ